jgi:hypothetical protein
MVDGDLRLRWRRWLAGGGGGSTRSGTAGSGGDSLSHVDFAGFVWLYRMMGALTLKLEEV